MKRKLALCLALCMLAALLAGCKDVSADPGKDPQEEEQGGAQTPAPTPDPEPSPTPDPTPQPEPVSDETTAGVNLRKEANTGAAVLTVIPKGSAVTVLSAGNDWCQVQYGELTGYVATGYLKTLGAGSGNPGNSGSSQKPTSAAVGNTTGVQSLDDKIKKVIDSVTDSSDSKLEQMEAVYQWVSENFRYKAITVDLSKGYTDDLINELAEAFLNTRKGACEHYAAIVYVLFRRLDASYAPIMVTGDRLDSKNGTWGEHAWVIMALDGVYYHFDGLYGRNHMGDTMKTFQKADADLESTHRWDHDAYPVCG